MFTEYSDSCCSTLWLITCSFVLSFESCGRVLRRGQSCSPDLPRRFRASRSLPYTLGGGTRHERYEDGPEQADGREGVEASRHGEPGAEEKPADKRAADGPNPADTRGPAQSHADHTPSTSFFAATASSSAL